MQQRRLHGFEVLVLRCIASECVNHSCSQEILQERQDRHQHQRRRCSLLPAPCSLLYTPCSLLYILPAPCSLLYTPCFLLCAPYSLLPAPYSLAAGIAPRNKTGLRSDIYS